MSAQTKENVVMADELVLNQEGEMQIHHTAHHVVQIVVVWIIFSQRYCLKATTTEGLTETITCATFSCSKQLLNYVIFF